jgi:hypothetical protein
MPALRQFCASIEVAGTSLNRRISHFASNFQAVFVNRRLWHAGCFCSGGRNFPASKIRSDRQRDNDARQAMGTARSATMQRLSILDWYRILGTQPQWTIFQYVRYALWQLR